MNKARLTYSATIGSILSIVFVVLVTILGEQFHGLKDWLAGLTGHHWTSKGVLMVILFALTMLILGQGKAGVSEKRLKRGVDFTIWTAIAGTVVLFVYFSLHYLGWY